MSSPAISAVVPVYNKRDFVRAAADALVAAARDASAARAGGAEVVFVDHHSTDGSYEIVRDLAAAHPDLVRVVRHRGGTISQVRNVGTRAARGAVLCFVDSDVVVPPGHFGALAAVLAETGAEAAGCEYDIPADPHWSERVWYELHVVRSDGERHYLNGGNLAVRRAPLEAVGGWAEHLMVGEDTELCARLRAAGCRIWESQRLNVIHLGNPKSIPAFFRKQVWHGESVLADRTLWLRNRVTLMVFAWMASCALAALALVAPLPLGPGARALLALLLPLGVPAFAVAYRYAETRRVTNPPAALLLYVVYFAARARAIVGALARPRRGATPAATPAR